MNDQDKRNAFAAVLRDLARELEEGKPVSFMVFSFLEMDGAVATTHALYANPRLGRAALMGYFEAERHALYQTQYNRTPRAAKQENENDPN